MARPKKVRTDSEGNPLDTSGVEQVKESLAPAVQFAHKALVCHVQKVNVRNEVHGENLVLACDIALRLMEPEDWSRVAAQKWTTSEKRVDAQAAAELLLSLSHMMLDGATFGHHYVEHEVAFKSGNKRVVVLPKAKINKFVMKWGEDLGMTFRIQAEADGDIIGVLANLMGKKVRIDTKWAGEELPIVQATQDNLDVSTTEQSKDLVEV